MSTSTQQTLVTPQTVVEECVAPDDDLPYLYRHPLFMDYVATTDGRVFTFKGGRNRFLKQTKNDKAGYLKVSLSCRSDNHKRTKTYLVSRFIRESIDDKMIQKGLEIDHMNRIVSDNRDENLRMVTREENNANSATKSVPLIVTNLNTSVVVRYKSIYECARALGASLGTVYKETIRSSKCAKRKSRPRRLAMYSIERLG